MSRRIYKRDSDCPLVQTSIFSAIQNLRKLEQSKKMKKKKESLAVVSPITIDVSDTDDECEEQSPVNTTKLELAFPLNFSDDEDESEVPSHCSDSNKTVSIGLNKPDANSTLLTDNYDRNVDISASSVSNSTVTSSDQTTVNILQNISIVEATTTNITDKPKQISNQPTLESNQAVNSQELPKKDNTNNYSLSHNQRTPLSSPKKYTSNFSPKKEFEELNEIFLKINNELISSVFQSKCFSNLLDQEENRMLQNIQKANPKYQYVCFKLYKWSPKWYILSHFVKRIKLNMEDQELVKLYKFLRDNDIADTDYTKENLITLLNRLDVADIKDICTKFKVNVPKKGKGAKGNITNNPTKKIFIDLILEKCRNQCTLTSKSIKDIVMDEIVKKLGKHVVKIKENFRKPLHLVFILATFANPQLYDLDEFFRLMPTNIQFPDYEIQQHMVFYSRSEFLSYVEARKFRDKMDVIKESMELRQMGGDIIKNLKELCHSIDEDDVNRFSQAPHLRRFTAKSVYISALSMISEKICTKFPQEVKEWLEYLMKEFPDSHRLGNWYFHLSKIYQNLKKPEDAAKLIITALRDKRNCLSEFQVHNLGERGQILKHKVNQYLHDVMIELLPAPIKPEDFPDQTIDQKTVRGNTSGRKRHYEVIDAEGCKTYKGVEEIALDYYRDRCGYTDGIHCEGSIICALFALFFWDLIYNPEKVVPGTFLSDKQYYPLDFYTPYFYMHRKEAIDRRLKDIEKDWFNRKVLDFATKNWGLYSHITSFCSITSAIGNTDFLATIINCIGRTTLARIFERLIKNFRENRSGLPDLLVWDSEQKKAKFIEVKGENDKLSIKQKLWLKYLETIGANIEVCYVHSIGSKKKIPKVKNVEKAIPKKKIPRQKKTNIKKTKKRNNLSDSNSDFEKVSKPSTKEKTKKTKNDSQKESTSDEITNANQPSLNEASTSQNNFSSINDSQENHNMSLQHQISPCLTSPSKRRKHLETDEFSLFRETKMLSTPTKKIKTHLP